MQLQGNSIGRWVQSTLLAATALLAVSAVSSERSDAATTVRVAQGLNRPVFLCSPPGDERIFIIEQRGVIKILTGGTVLATPFLDIDALIPAISGNDERGLLGLAFPPDYATTGYFFVYYYSNTARNVVARYQVSGDPDVANPASGQTLFDVVDPFENHNGGCMQFGPDGYLYVGTGDGGSGGDPGNRAQNKLSTFGKMLRLDVSTVPYTIPADNPFVGDGSYLPEIWSLGLRNPWRWSFDRLTGEMWIGDVGQNLWEEIDYEAAGDGGRNYGWRLTEGNACYNPGSGCDDGDPVITYPVLVYSHGAGCSITGGYVYRGEAIPSLQGRYFYSDFCTPFIKSFVYNGSVTDQQDHTVEFAPGGGLSINNIGSYGEDAFGELYIIDRGGSSTGEIFKIVPNATDAPSLPTEQGMFLQPARPNPFTGSTQLQLVLDRPGSMDVSIFDLAGRVVREMPLRFSVAGTQPISWDGRDTAGRTMPAGVYFVRAAGSNGVATQSVQLVR